MMIWAYGEDGLTFWALKNKLADILAQLKDKTPSEECKVFYRLSFGRGGKSKANFGEFDFVILSNNNIYLGESKWDKSKRVSNGLMKLSEVQVRRHSIFRKYITSYFATESLKWSELSSKVNSLFVQDDIEKSVPKKTTLLAQNILSFLQIAQCHFGSTTPEVVNILLYLHCQSKKPNVRVEGFQVVVEDCCDAMEGNFVKI